MIPIGQNVRLGVDLNEIEVRVASGSIMKKGRTEFFANKGKESWKFGGSFGIRF